MIRYAITEPDLVDRIKAKRAKWFDEAAAIVNALSEAPTSSEFKPHWSKIKQVYINLQHSKCCFCETALEGKINQDVEHFRPKAEVKRWELPERLAGKRIRLLQPDDDSSEPGYKYLAYHPWNYAIACKFCNSTLKKNFFPIGAARFTSAKTAAGLDRREKAYLIYPIGENAVDPEFLIEFEGLSPRPKKRAPAFDQRRALVTIDFFQLDDAVNRPELFKARAYLLQLFYLELESFRTASSAELKRHHQDVIDSLTDSSKWCCVR